MLAIIDYGMGNLKSVLNAFNVLGADPQIVDQPQQLDKADRIVMPGVGAFADGMSHLQKKGWIEELNQQILKESKPFLGICLGLQLLATLGTEVNDVKGLGWIPGEVNRLPDNNDIRIPHIGWNDVVITQPDGMYSGLGETAVFYFIHSYAMYPETPDSVNGICDYGSNFVASIQKDNIWATQFHPEKSQKAGLLVLKNFLNYNN